MRLLSLMLLLAAGAADAQTPAEKDLETLTARLAGRYDNDLQVFFADADAGAPAPRIQAAFRPVAARHIGANVFLAERRGDGAAARALHALALDGDSGAIRARVLVPRDPSLLDAARLAKLRPGDFANAPVCEFHWRRRANQFVATPAPGAEAACEGETLLLTPDELRISRGPGSEYVLKRARAFECWTAVLRGARHGDRGEGEGDWMFSRGGWIHDQGGVLRIATDETPPRDIRLKLRRVEWPSGPNRPSLTLYAHEGDDPRAVSYAWTEADGERIGLNLRWLQASCTHAPARLFDGE